MSERPVITSGDGTRPATSGGVDNMGGADSFTGKKNAAGEDISAPAPHERMQDKKMNAENMKHDDSTPYDLTEDLTPETNREQAPAAPVPKMDA